jgi:hypothetical protein
MASAKRTPQVSRISRGRTVAYARKQKPTDGGGDGPDEPGSDAPPSGTDDATAPSDAASEPAAPPGTEDAPATLDGAAAPAAPAEAEATASSDEPPEPASSATAATDAPPVEPVQARVTTARMPALAAVGTPPGIPAVAPIPTAAAGSAEDPTRMPGPRAIPDGHPDDPASPPGRVPPGDSRSLRRRADRHEFALVYRIQTYVISRVGVVGTRGQWRVVEYPTPTMASHAYAKECSRFVSDGFSDYRE